MAVFDTEGVSFEKVTTETQSAAEVQEIIAEKATLYCSFASVKAVLGHSEGDNALVISDDEIQWSGPPGVITLATSSDVQLTY